jgi:thymidine kinase
MHFPAPANWEVGWIEVICGSMFSGKTEELIRRVKRADIAKQKVQIFKPAIDDRFSNVSVVSHSEQKAQAITISHPEEILAHVVPESRVIAIDEAQFLAHGVVDVAQKLADRGLRVIVAGLDLDYLGVPFGPMPKLMALAEYVTKMHAICTVCGAPASRSQRVQVKQELPLSSRLASTETSRHETGSPIYVGASESYEARCRQHFRPVVET